MIPEPKFRLWRFSAYTRLIVFFSAISQPDLLHAGGVKGIILSDEATPLSWATIYIKQLGSGTVANEQGYYEITLPPGTYDLIYQHVGYETQQKQIEVNEDFVTLNIRLKQQVIVLQNVTITANNEDPAYTIMRKAIAKAKYHNQQIDSFSARVYIKGSGKLKDYPWLAKKALEKEGIKKNRVFVSESVSEIQYRRPSIFREKVISIRSDGRDNNTSPNAFVFGSFYQPIIAETVSPLSPAAFSYYRFEYQGTFKDRQYDISKIKVIPRSRGDNVVEGMLYIVEDWWSIHSLDFTTTKLGLHIDINQMYAPVNDKAWLPVSQHFNITGRFFGFEFEYTYLATVSNYHIVLNQELMADNLKVIDEKLEKEKALETEKNLSRKSQSLQKRLEAGQEITTRELKALMKEYEKQEQKQQPDPGIIAITSFEVDSTAYRRDSAYWAAVRPVPLSDEEIKGYRITDSLAVEERKKEAGDTLRRSEKNKAGFQPWDVFTGDFYRLSKRASLWMEPLQVLFNPVEGFVLLHRSNFGYALHDSLRSRLNLRPTLRYAFAPAQLSGTLRLQLRNINGRVQIEGGRYVQQFNADEPILPVINTFTSLLAQQNYMKIYEQDFISARLQQSLSPRVNLSTTLAYARRRELFNRTNYSWRSKPGNEGYSPNAPENLELRDTGFPDHYAFTGSATLSVSPWLKYRIRNGRKYPIESSSPTFSLRYDRGMPLLKSSIHFSRAELGLSHSFGIGVRGFLNIRLQAGKLFNTDSLAFMDYRHFMGNLTPLATANPTASFRLLDYYRYSTTGQYLVTNLNYRFRKLLLSSVYKLHLLGIRESVFINYLYTARSENYFEAGYSINGILRFFRLEVAAAFQNGTYQTVGLRIGIASNLMVRFSNN